MSTTELVELINKLPAEKQREVEDFIFSLVTDTVSGEKNILLTYGSMKGLIRYMANDFDEPLEDFKEYM